MKKIILILFFIVFCTKGADLNVAAQQHQKMPICLGLIGKKNKELKQVAERIKQDLEFSGQFTVTIRSCGRTTSKNEVSTIAKDGFPLVIFLNHCAPKNDFQWRVYDTTQLAMLGGKKSTKRDNSWR